MRSVKCVLGLSLVLSFIFISGLVFSKPHEVDGENYPEGRYPQQIKNNNYPRTYYPNTEKLAANEMRITAIGTGMPNLSPSNMAAAFLVELGNGESFLFDLGTGSTDRLAGTESHSAEPCSLLSPRSLSSSREPIARPCSSDRLSSLLSTPNCTIPVAER